jgi:hypothetical protein
MVFRAVPKRLSPPCAGLLTKYFAPSQTHRWTRGFAETLRRDKSAIVTGSSRGMLVDTPDYYS